MNPFAKKKEPVKWWTKCGVCEKLFEVTAPPTLNREEIDKVFFEKHGVHLFPTRCSEHYNPE